MLYIIFSVWLITVSNPPGINRFRGHTGIESFFCLENEDTDGHSRADGGSCFPGGGSTKVS